MGQLLLSKGGWLLRILTVSVLVVVIALSLFPRVVSHISTSAVVNAPILVIRSPVEGQMEGYELQAGALFQKGRTLLSFARPARTKSNGQILKPGSQSSKRPQ